MATVEPTGEGQSFPCTNCGAKLTYDAASQKLKCPYCGHQQAVPQQAPAPAAARAQGPAQQFQGGAPGGIREIPLEEGMRLAVKGFGTPVTQVGCKDCGATVNVAPGEQTAKCAFCGINQVLAQESAGTNIRPESLVPFKMDKAAANQKFEQWLGTLWFRPNDLKKMAKVQEMGGVYIPFWTFDSMVHSNWTADAGYYYYETEYYTDANGRSQSRQVQRTRWEPAWGNRSDFFDDVLVCASKGLPQELVVEIHDVPDARARPLSTAISLGLARRVVRRRAHDRLADGAGDDGEHAARALRERRARRHAPEPQREQQLHQGDVQARPIADLDRGLSL